MRRAAARWRLLLLALWLLATLGIRPLILPDEGRYIEVAREMHAGDWLVPEPFYWLDAAATQVFGVGQFVGRFGAAAARAHRSANLRRERRVVRPADGTGGVRRETSRGAAGLSGCAQGLVACAWSKLLNGFRRGRSQGRQVC